VTAGDLATGARIGRYVIIERVGNGAMGVVYGAYDPELDRKIALKLLRPGHGVKETARARLLREAKAIARLSHPNVVAVHDVGVFEDQVFLAMEFVPGGTIKSWLEEAPRTWRQILDVFIAAGRGLIAAHAAGLVHRDFKPDNVLLDKDGRPRVVDFGIARQAGAGTGRDADDEVSPLRRGDAGVAEAAAAALRESSGNVAPLLTLTKTGAMVGTPAYMAPEQFMGERGDERSDQFSFCVALYEALYGQRPFEGGDVLSLSLNVTQEQFRPLPKDRGVPVWIKRAILRGMKADPGARWGSMIEVIAALANDPVIKLRKRLVVGGVTGLIATSLIIAWQVASQRRANAEREIARNLDEANRSRNTAAKKGADARALRGRAFAAFDALDKEGGETLWRQTRALVPAIDSEYDQAERSFETAFMLDQARVENRARLADLRYEHLVFADDFRLATRVSVLEERLAAADADGSRRKAYLAPGTITFRIATPAAKAVLEHYEHNALDGRRSAKAMGPLAGDGAQRTASLAPGSYRLTVTAPGKATVVYPFEVRRGQTAAADLTLPPASSVPNGFVYVPPGEFWFGDSDEQLRSTFLATVPIHRRTTDAFLIARNETTYQEWLTFIDAMPAAEQGRLLPEASATSHGSLRVRRVDGEWRLTFEPGTHRYVAKAGEPITYVGRKRNTRQDWLQFPVAGISAGDAERYLTWLAETKRVPGARFCTELEWERASRGADDRLFPCGDELDVDDANFDRTYGRVASAYGPDVVGSHPKSRSPFGVDDLSGNVLEFVKSSQAANETVIRGGAYYFNSVSCRSTNREPVPPTLRDVTTGIRVCASTSRVETLRALPDGVHRGRSGTL
jgi:serine/threonine protein kinase/formylglycine-generating enzyme required for sulfatase activity